MRNSSKLKLAAVAIGAGSIIMIAQPAKAQTALQTEIDKVTAVATMLTTLVTAFTTVLITPMGISAAMKIFKTLVLFNL